MKDEAVQEDKCGCASNDNLNCQNEVCCGASTRSFNSESSKIETTFSDFESESELRQKALLTGEDVEMQFAGASPADNSLSMSDDETGTAALQAIDPIRPLLESLYVGALPTTVISCGMPTICLGKICRVEVWVSAEFLPDGVPEKVDFDIIGLRLEPRKGCHSFIIVKPCEGPERRYEIPGNDTPKYQRKVEKRKKDHAAGRNLSAPVPQQIGDVLWQDFKQGAGDGARLVCVVEDECCEVHPHGECKGQNRPCCERMNAEELSKYYAKDDYSVFGQGQKNGPGFSGNCNTFTQVAMNSLCGVEWEVEEGGNQAPEGKVVGQFEPPPESSAIMSSISH